MPQVSGVVDNERSELLGLEQLERIQQQVANGYNVVLFANHQSEADPQIYSCLLDPLYPAPSKGEASFAESTIFVAVRQQQGSHTMPAPPSVCTQHSMPL